ncbi:MAG: DUF4317 domain-containing protein [Eubacteriales bacterium]
MNDREIAELRRRFTTDKSNISRIRGCYVNEQREIVSRFDQSLGLMPPEESEEILAILKKTLSGSLGRNLVDIVFSNSAVLEGEQHALLSNLRASALGDDGYVETFYAKVKDSVTLDSSYMILLACDSYDVYSRSKDGTKGESSTVFTYIICAVCPVKLPKPTLSYFVYENRFRNVVADSVISAPELGFMFPAFDDRSANIYNALMYTKSASDAHEEFVESIFAAPMPMPAETQKETFRALLSESVADDCGYDVVSAIHEQLCDMIDEHKASRDSEPLEITRDGVGELLRATGVPDERIAAFTESYGEKFGAATALSPKNLVEQKKFEVRTPDVVITVDPEKSDLVETRVIDGLKYIMVRADAGVEVNGVTIAIKKEEE